MIACVQIITLNEPELKGTYAVERQADGRIVLDPVGPSEDELIARSGGRRLTADELEREFGDLPSDDEG
jgi:hypothetical protein